MSQLLTTIRDNHRRLWADLRKVDPPASEQDRRWAEAVRRGCIFFYGTQEVEIGLFGVDWTGAHIAHQEWRAQLNRFFCLPPLAALHEAGEGDDLPGLARQLIEDWIDQHPRTDENAPAAGDNLLNMSIRVGQSTGRGWWPSVARFNCSDAFDDAFLAKMMASSDAQLDCIRARLNPQGNWRISQLDTLLYCGLVVPGLDSHLAFAARMLNECFHRQIQPDGAHEEHCPSYHSWMCDVFTSYWRLGRARPELGLKIDAERIIRMWDYLVCSRTGDGDMVPLNDSSRSTKGAAPLAPLLARRAAVLAESGLAPEEWDLERHPSRYFPHAGQVFLRTGWQEDDAVTSFDASRWDGWHSHLGRNGVSLYAAGRYLLPDPGVFSYEASDPFSAYGRSTRAHNTINFGLMNQGEANPDTHTVSIHQDLAVVASDYQGGYYGADFHGNCLTWH